MSTDPVQPTLFIGKGATRQELNLKYANRHGLIAGATGTGKTVTLQVLAEGFADAGVPVFAADIKGDLSGISQKGKPHPKLEERAETIGFEDYDYEAYPTIFWDLFGTDGHPIRATLSDLGPVLLARMLRLSETQEGILNIAFAVADDEGMPILDLKDLKAMLQFIGERRKELSLEYGNVTTASIGAIQRQLLVLERQGAENFFGEPALKLTDLMRTTQDGRGYINILAADKLVQSPRLYATFLLWLLSELFEELPERGDADRPRMVFFFDEAHLLFDDAPDVLLEKVEQVVRLIRSKGIGIYFVTQNPIDIPVTILGQLGNRVQHALRAFTPRDRKAVRAAAETFRPNPDFDTEDAITQLGVGEALVSTLEKKGVPTVVDRTLIRPPRSRMGPASDIERGEVINNSPLFGLYEELLDRESAYEKLQARAAAKSEEAERAEQREMDRDRRYDDRQSNDLDFGSYGNSNRRSSSGGYSSARRTSSRQERYEDDQQHGGGFLDDLVGAAVGGASGRRSSGSGRSRGRRSNRQSVGEALAKSMARSVGSQVGRSIARGVLGGMLRRR